VIDIYLFQLYALFTIKVACLSLMITPCIGLISIYSVFPETVSYGKEKPLYKEKTEECWARNRRAHFEPVK